MRFTDSPYEDFMKEKSYFKGVPPNLPPKGSRCDGCLYWHGLGSEFCSRRAVPAQAGEQYRCRPSERKALPHTGQGRVSVIRSTVSDLSSTGSRGSTADRK